MVFIDRARGTRSLVRARSLEISPIVLKKVALDQKWVLFSAAMDVEHLTDSL